MDNHTSSPSAPQAVRAAGSTGVTPPSSRACAQAHNAPSAPQAVRAAGSTGVMPPLSACVRLRMTRSLRRRQCLFSKLAVVLFALFLCSLCFSQEFGANRGTFVEMAKRFEIKPMAEAPVWANRPEAPLFRLAWVSDMHIENAERKDYHHRLIQQIKSEIHPLALLITGDSWGIGAEPVARLKAFRTFLNAECGKDLPYIALPGDNWPVGFEQIFGSTKFAFTLGGYRFICASMDRGGKANGCSLYAPETLEWLQAQFTAAGEHPVIFVQHEPIEPPMTLDAPKVASIMDSTPTAILALGGHVHLNLEFPRGHWRQWVGPSTGRSHRPAFKVLSFYRFGVVSQDWEEGVDGKYAPVNKWLCAPVGKEYRKCLAPVAEFRPEDFQKMPVIPYQFDASLDSHSEELTQKLMQFSVKYALKNMQKK